MVVGLPPDLNEYGDERPTFVYCLLDPVTGRPRYVGKTVNPYARYRDHVYNQSRTDQRYPVNRWTKKLKKRGAMPVMRIVAVCGDDDWQSVERRWIRHLRKQYDDLLNIADGGEGGGGGCVRTPEHRKKIADALRGRTHPPRSAETRARLSAALKGKPKPPMTDEHRRKISESQMGVSRGVGRKLAPEHRAKITAVLARPDVVRAAASAKAHWWTVTTPTGQTELVHNLQRFAEARGLDPASLNKVANGRQGRKQHKGYRVEPSSITTGAA